VKSFWTWFDKAINGMAVLAGGVLVFISAAVCYSVVMRYFFRSPSIWVVQTTEYGLLWMVFLATAWLLKEKGHVGVDIVYSLLGDRLKVRFDLVMYTLGGIACSVIFFFSLAYTLECITRGVNDVRAVTVPKWLVFVIIPVGTLFLCVQFFRTVWARYRVLKDRG
jgi:TRAP-type C4-dicarboxylate transport system permease small subunit